MSEGFQVSLGVYDETIGLYTAQIIKSGNLRITAEDVQQIEKMSDMVILTMKSEWASAPAFTPTEKRYDSGKLYSGVDSFFRPDTFVKLPDIAKYDFEEAGKCLLFDRSTAAAFHSLRAIESLLQEIYRNKIGKLSDDMTWGKLESALVDREVLSPSINDQVKHIRIRYRNKTQHPNLIYDIDAAQDLFNLCVALANGLINYLDKE